MAISMQRVNELEGISSMCDREIVAVERDLTTLQGNSSQLTPARLLPALQSLGRTVNQLSRAVYVLSQAHREEAGTAASAMRH